MIPDRFDLHIHFHGLHPEVPPAMLADFKAQLDRIEHKENIIIMEETQALALLATIDTNTTKAGVTLQANSDALQGVNNDLDTIIAKVTALPPGTVPQDIIDGLTLQASKTQALSDAGDAMAVALTAIANKEKGALATNPVPVPIPDPTPLPTV